MNWQFTDQTNNVVARLTEDGLTESCAVEVIADWIAEGNIPDAYAPPAADIQALIIAATQTRLDTFARTRNYDGILSACTYATDPSPVFSAEGQRAVALRSATWGTLYAIMEEVQTGVRPMPTGYEEIETILPALSW